MKIQFTRLNSHYSNFKPRNYIAGFNNLPNILRWVRVPAITNPLCNQQYTGSITNAMLCAGYPQGGKDSCQGDSGGPLVCQSGTNAVITGIVSWGYGCASAGFPGVYARVTYFLSWIQDNMVLVF